MQKIIDCKNNEITVYIPTKKGSNLIMRSFNVPRKELCEMPDTVSESEKKLQELIRNWIKYKAVLDGISNLVIKSIDFSGLTFEEKDIEKIVEGDKETEKVHNHSSDGNKITFSIMRHKADWIKKLKTKSSLFHFSHGVSTQKYGQITLGLDKTWEYHTSEGVVTFEHLDNKVVVELAATKSPEELINTLVESHLIYQQELYKCQIRISGELKIIFAEENIVEYADNKFQCRKNQNEVIIKVPSLLKEMHAHYAIPDMSRWDFSTEEYVLYKEQVCEIKSVKAKILLKSDQPKYAASEVSRTSDTFQSENSAFSSGFMVHSQLTEQTRANGQDKFEIIVPSREKGLEFYQRFSADPNQPWTQYDAFATEQGRFLSSSLINTPWGTSEFVAITANKRLLHYYHNGSEWVFEKEIADNVSGTPAFIRGSRGSKGNFEVVVPSNVKGLSYYYRDNDAENLPWIKVGSFAADKGRFLAVALLENNQSKLEIIAVTTKGKAYHYAREVEDYNAEPEKWKLINEFSNVSGLPGFIQNKGGNQGYKLVIPSNKGGIDFYTRYSDNPHSSWIKVNSFAMDKKFSAVSLIQNKQAHLEVSAITEDFNLFHYFLATKHWVPTWQKIADDVTFFNCKEYRRVKFFKAIEEGDKQKVEKMLNNGVEVNAVKPYGHRDTALHVAAWKNRSNIAKLLLENQANPFIGKRGHRNETPYGTAVGCNSSECVEILSEFMGRRKVYNP